MVPPGLFSRISLQLIGFFRIIADVLSTMLSLEIRAMTLCEAWWCMEEEPDLWTDGVLPRFLLAASHNYSGAGLKTQEKSLP